jgi:LacI family transcriptional regulator
LRPNLTRSEHPIIEMVNESVRLLMDRIKGGLITQKRNVVFPSALVVGDSCAPPTAR